MTRMDTSGEFGRSTQSTPNDAGVAQQPG